MTTITTGTVIPASQINQWAPPGAVIMYAAATAPSGWFICDGSAISRTTYSDLFTAISTTYGTGDGSTTFNLPDCRGRMSVGYAPSGGHTDVATIGLNEAKAVGFRRPKHATSLVDPGHTHDLTAGNNTVNLTLSMPPNHSENAGVTTVTTNSHTTGITVGSGNANDYADASPYLVLNFIIRAKDV